MKLVRCTTSIYGSFTKNKVYKVIKETSNYLIINNYGQAIKMSYIPHFETINQNKKIVKVLYEVW